jgi:hypothetical protein
MMAVVPRLLLQVLDVVDLAAEVAVAAHLEAGAAGRSGLGRGIGCGLWRRRARFGAVRRKSHGPSEPSVQGEDFVIAVRAPNWQIRVNKTLLGVVNAK